MQPRDPNEAFFTIVEDGGGRAVMERMLRTIADAVASPAVRAALLADVGVMMRASYEAGMRAGVAEQLVTIDTSSRRKP